jgi:hypothetical protein
MASVRAILTTAAAVVALVAGVLTAEVAVPAQRAEAADPKDFNPGMIISDQVFYDSSTMTVAQIQSFLNARVPTCAGGYVCLRDYSQATTSQPSRSEGCAAYAGQSSESAAQIIYKVARACGINPRSLIVLIEKEQGLISDATPSSRQYRSATGYGCPDTADCDATYYGFFNQVYNAAWQFRKYRANPGIRAYQAGRYNTILWHPNTSCGSSQVYIQNQATAGLYIYTPYRPNAAALANLYGTGDSCSSYGNRNFWRMFTDWFGSTSAPAAPPAVAVPTAEIPLVYAIESDGDFFLYPGTGTGGWRTRLQTGTNWGALRFVGGAGDLDGDGSRDVVAVGTQGELWIYPTDSVGRFTDRVQAGTGFGEVTALLAAGDFDGDGDQDLFTRTAAGDLVLHANNGAGRFAPGVRVGTGWGGLSALTGALDFDGDGNDDLLARDADGALRLYRGDGAAGWLSMVRIGSGWQGMTAILTPGDFDGDGAADVLARDAAGVLQLYPGNGTGGWKARKQVGTGWNGMTVIAGPGAEAPGPIALTGGVGDLTGDGTADVVAVAGATAWLYPGNGSGGWLARRALPGDWTGLEPVLAGGDFDGDGLRDLFATDAAGDLWRYPGDGRGGLGPRVKAGNGWSSMTAIVGAVDPDGDRDWDLLARDADGRLLLYPGDGAGGFSAPTQVGPGWQGMSWIVGPGDFDGDGRSDLLAVDAAGEMQLYAGTGSGGYRARVKVGQGWQGMTWVTSPGDFDGDGNADVLARRSDGVLVLYPGNGRGGWLAPREVGTAWQVMDQIL